MKFGDLMNCYYGMCKIFYTTIFQTLFDIWTLLYSTIANPFFVKLFSTNQVTGEQEEEEVDLWCYIKGFEMYFCSIGVLNVGKLCNNEKKNGEINLDSWYEVCWDIIELCFKDLFYFN